jgi:ferredoxin
MAYIITSDCMSCAVCEFMCPRAAIRPAKNQFIILRDLCDDCGKCVSYCVVQAIVPRAAFKQRQARTLASDIRRAIAKTLD